MAETITLTVRLTRETKDRLDALALSTRRSKAFLAAAAIDAYVAANAWQVEAMGAAVAEADAGGAFFEHEDVMDHLERRARGERPQRPGSAGTTGP
jgi:RHH-type rel operon transcriptional repressor/antitoxin RelB